MSGTNLGRQNGLVRCWMWGLTRLGQYWGRRFSLGFPVVKAGHRRMKRPMLWIAVSYMLGIVVADNWGYSVWPILLSIFALAAIGFFVQKARLVVLGVLLFAPLGWIVLCGVTCPGDRSDFPVTHCTGRGSVFLPRISLAPRCSFSTGHQFSSRLADAG